ncbi:PLAT/LH2 domain-containing protein [Hellea sp.]|nr:PLAT/LH2 domain-containing protein [Hellea sp.]
MTKIKTTFTRHCLKALIPLGVIAYAGPAHAEIINYCIVSKTADILNAGTTGRPQIKLRGEFGTSGWKYIKGNQDRGLADDRDIELDDLGAIEKIDISHEYNNGWMVQYIRIYRDTDCNRKSKTGGYSEFSLNREFENATKKELEATKFIASPVTVSPSGGIVRTDKRLIIANYGDNPTGSVKPIMPYKESWSRVEKVSMSTTSTTNLNASATLSYESPSTVYGKFGASASAGWSQAESEARTQSEENISSSEYNWQYNGAPRTLTFRKAEFTIPYVSQLYKSSYNGKSYVMRTIGAMIRPAGQAGSYLEIPKTDRAGNIVPIGLDLLEDEWLVYLAPRDAEKFRAQYLQKFLSNGYVVRGAGGNVVSSAPTTPPVTRPVTRPTTPPVTRPVARPSRPQAAPPVTSPSNVSWSQDGVTGYNMSSAYFNGGRFEETGKGTGVWHEYGASGPARFTFKETNRDEWSVYMTDAARGVRIQLDAYRNMIGYGDSNTPMRDQYKATTFGRIK